MAKIGHFGDVKFRVKMTENMKLSILSFENMKWDTSINVEEHRRQGMKPLIEPVDRNSDSVNMDIYLSAYNRVHPMKILLRLRKYNLNANAFPLVIGGKRIGSHKFIITNISNAMEKFYKNGKLVVVRASVTFKEYPEKKKKSKKAKLITSKESVNVLNGSSGTSSKKNNSSKSKGYDVYEVQKGDTLWDLAEDRYGSGVKYTKIFNANKTESEGFDVISNPSLILPGWIIKIPT